jgi:L-iditol 2-dehydrogenase
MKAAVLHGREDLRVEEVVPRPLESGEVRIRIEAALTCGTDLKVYRRGYHAKMIQPPAVFGHELAGTVCETAPEAGDWRIGDRVVAANSAPCRGCLWCRQGQENLCDDLLFLNGAYAESIVVPARLVRTNLMRLKPETGFEDAALVEPLGCVVQGLEDARVRAGQCVLVLGSGPIGLMIVALATAAGCEVVLAGRGETRLDTARRLNAAQVVEVPAGSHTAQVVRAATERHFDVVMEAVGHPDTWTAAVQLVRKGGLVNFIGGCPSGTNVSIDTDRMHYSGLNLVSSFHHTPRTIRRALEWIEAGVVRAQEFVDGECALEELPGLFRRMASGNRAVKTRVRVRK